MFLMETSRAQQTREPKSEYVKSTYESGMTDSCKHKHFEISDINKPRGPVLTCRRDFPLPRYLQQSEV